MLALLFEGNEETSLQARLRANWRRAVLLGGLALLPFILYKAFLLVWLGSLGPSIGTFFEPIPFEGLIYYWPWQVVHRDQIQTIVFPALVCAGISVRALWKGIWTVEAWVLLANVLLFVVFLNRESYAEFGASGRITTGVVLAAIYCLPSYARLKNSSRSWFWVSSAFWLALVPFLLLLPVASYVATWF